MNYKSLPGRRLLPIYSLGLRHSAQEARYTPDEQFGILSLLRPRHLFKAGPEQATPRQEIKPEPGPFMEAVEKPDFPKFGVMRLLDGNRG